MEDSVVRKLIFEWQERVMTRQGVERQMEPRILDCFGSRPIKIITGFRRSGKSFLTQQIARKLVTAASVPRENVLYLNLEDYRLQECVTPGQLDQIFTLFMQTTIPGHRLVIFDEIQNVPSWDRFIRTLYEREDNLEMILTGSNSELLSAELGSNLAGRFIEFFLHTFSFREFLQYRNELPKNRREFDRRMPIMNRLFNEYLSYGGLPEVFDIPSGEAKLSYLSGVLTKVILDDVVKRFRVEHVGLLEKLLTYLLATVGNVTSYAALVKKSAALGVPLKFSTVVDYVSYLQKSFALFETEKFSWKQSRHFATTRKYYAVDTGLASIVRPVEENRSFRLENIVFLELKRRSADVFFGSSDSGREIDFLTRTGAGWEQYQVTDTLTGENRKRELGAFALAAPYLGSGQVLLTLDDVEETILYEGLEVRRCNIVRWLVG
jgi:predicted AAA+ superfamily ATPase